MITITEEMLQVFGNAWTTENEIAGCFRAPGDRRRAGLEAVVPLIEAAVREEMETGK